MKTTEKEIADEYKKMIKHLQREVGKSGVVKSVDEGTQEATVQLTIHDKDETVHVLLNATPTADLGVNIYPAVDSDVVVCDIDGDGIYTIIQYGKVDKVIVKIGSVPELEITEGNIKLNGGENGGLVIVDALVDQLKLIEDKVNDIIEKWNSFCSVYAPGSPASTGLPATLSTSTHTPLENTEADTITNGDVLH